MALLQAGLAAGTSLIGGMFGSKANSKAARDQFRYQDALDKNSYLYQRSLQDVQNGEFQNINQRVEAQNREILDHHSVNESTVRTETSDSREDRSTSTGSIDFQRLVSDAEAAGFNPLTVLRAGGLAGYSTNNTVFTSRGSSATEVHSREKVARELMTYFSPPGIPQGPQPGQAPVVQPNGNPIGDALKAGFDAWSSFDKFAAERGQLERELARAQIANLNSDTGRNNRTFAIPSWTDSGQRASAGGVGGAVRAVLPTGKAALGAVAAPTVGEVKVTNPYPWGNVQSWLRDAAASEERYGELLSNVAGGLNAAADFAGLIYQGGKAANAATGGVGTSAGNTARNYFNHATKAIRDAWNSPAWNAK